MMIFGQNYRILGGAWYQYFGTEKYILFEEVEDNSLKKFAESQCTPWLWTERGRLIILVVFFEDSIDSLKHFPV